MKVHHSLDNIREKINRPVLTIGTFDGVHVGHQKILKNLVNQAKSKNGEAVLFTFSPHPRQVLFPNDSSLQLIQTQEEKIEKLEQTGLDHLIVYPFTEAFSRLTATEFVRDFLVNTIGIQSIVIGYDHHFGRNREGTLEHLKELAPVYQFEVEEINAHDIDDVNVSSTKIRDAILTGDFATANEYLGQPFEVRGYVKHGVKLGRSLGYPTANISVNGDDKIMPCYGVYVVEIVIDTEKYYGIASYGIRPTIEDNNSPELEVYILDFEKNIYENYVIVNFLSKLRGELKFDSTDELQKQIQIDEEKTLEWIDNNTSVTY